MTGGEDIDPSYYHEDKDPLLEKTNEARDVSDYALINAAIKADIPTLCTCRGMQFLNVICGGTLYQDFPSKIESDIIHRDPNHKVFVYHDITATTLWRMPSAARVPMKSTPSTTRLWTNSAIT